MTERGDFDPNSRLKRNLSLWAIRWVIGLGLAFAIVAFTGEHLWLPWAAAGVALVSLLVILGLHLATKSSQSQTSGGSDPDGS